MGLFDKIFKKSESRTTTATALINEQSSFTTWAGDPYANDIYRGAVDAIARNAGKLKGSHFIRYRTDERKNGDYKLDRLLQVRPNEYMNAYDFLYKMVTRYYLYNNSFALIQRDKSGNVTGLYPITSSYVEFLSDSLNNLYCRFTLNDGTTPTFNYKDLIHLRRNFNGNNLLGDDNAALAPALELAHTQNEGIINGIKAGANIRGILKYTQIMNPTKLQEEKEAFIADYLTMANDGGVIALDQKADFTPIESKPVILSAEQTEAIENKIYSYLGVSKAIVTSDYNEDQFSAFYESVLEPIALALGLEFTQKLFTEREQAFGNVIIFESGRLQFTNNKTKIQLIKEIMPMGLLTVNQALEILNLPSVDDGDRRLQSLNYIDQEKAEAYQLANMKTSNNVNNKTNNKAGADDSEV